MRATTLYRLAGPKTFRRSSTKLFADKNKKNTGWGDNLQNVEKSLREIFIPDGYEEQEMLGRCKYWLQTGDLSVFKQEELDTLRVFIQVDQSGAEALIVAYECRNADYRQLFIHGVKPHVYVALKLFVETWKQKVREHGLKISPVDIDEINSLAIAVLKTNPNWKDLDALIKASDNWSLSERYYYLAKQTVHSANYDIQWAMFILNILEKSGGKIVVNKEDGQRFLMTYRGLFPEIPERNQKIRQIIEKAVRDKEIPVLYNLHGFPYYITNYNITEVNFKEYYAWSAQSTVGEITRIAYCTMQEYIEDCKKKWDILQDNHDSFLVQSPLVEAKECSSRMTSFMNQKLISPSDGVEFSMKSEANIGFNWAPRKEGSNEVGLQEIRW